VSRAQNILRRISDGALPWTTLSWILGDHFAAKKEWQGRERKGKEGERKEQKEGIGGRGKGKVRQCPLQKFMRAPMDLVTKIIDLGDRKNEQLCDI